MSIFSNFFRKSSKESTEKDEHEIVSKLEESKAMADKSGQKSTTDTDPLYNYTIHAAVFLCDETNHNRIAMIAGGTDSLYKVSQYVREGAKGALSVKKIDNALNYDIVFGKNKELLEFLDKYFPNSLSDTIRKRIELGGKYFIRSYDDT